MNSSAFMDKQIMGLSGSPSGAGGAGGSDGDIFDLMHDERRDNGGVLKKEEIRPSYDFQPIRPAPSPPTSSSDDPARHSRFSSASLYGESTLGPEIKLARHYGASVDDVESTVKKYADLILHSLEGLSSRLSQLESRTCILENSVDDLKVSIGNNCGITDGKMRQLENILREVQTGVQVLRDKQEITEAQLELTKLQLSTKTDHHQSESSIVHPEPPQLPPQQYQQQLTHPSLPQQPIQQTSQPIQLAPSHPNPPPLPAPTPNAPPPPPPPQQTQPSVPFTSTLGPPPPMPAVPSFPRDQSYSLPLHQVPQYTSSPGQPNEAALQQQQYQMQAPQPQQVLPQGQHYHSLPHLSQYSQPVQPEDSKSFIPPPQSYTSSIRQQSPPPQPPTGAPLHQYYGTNPPLYELPPASRPGSGSMPNPSNFEPYLYNSSPSHYNMKTSPFSSAPPPSGGSSSFQRLPTAKILPQAALPAGSASGGAGPTGNRVPIDDVVDKVATMGFSREQVRATVRKLTENGQSVDLNVVLDKLMNGGEAQQPQKGWFGR
ncbi:hypothetical protein AXF42_Ash007344 [Apostasia shenzhenica]|uniref:DUF1421 domain-containing protein n=1 Tax=Apostasia shenzhenica TaxID=1088818 RepID=A0A2I0B9X2_9ASPA|nr:hypothetical protein AXF42_Ash007344 [Apostasia shenzhenica]